jgi:hypothetical protein
MADLTQNPDYRLVMTFLKNINPGDMDQESSEQLMMIGQRIQAGGALSDREREMLQAVVGAIPQMPTDPNMGGRGSRGGGGEGEMNLPMDTTMPSNATSNATRFMAQKNAAMNKMNSAMPSNMTEAEMVQAEEDAYFERLRLEQEQMYNMNQEAMRQQTQSPAPMTSPRPQMRPSAPMTSPRPQMRPTR